MAEVEVVNIVAKLSFGRELALDSVADLLENSEGVSRVNYAPEENHWLQSYFTLSNIEEEWYVAFYRSGSCTIVGCDSFFILERIAGTVKDVMSPIEWNSEPSLEIKNIVAVGEVGHKLDLSHLAIGLGLENIEYEPEQFPGLVYRTKSPSSVILLFNSGKAVITGIRTESQASEAFDELTQKVEQLLKS
jgi:transcription initiation factor TFIID TATA-box-binding protein